jgi:hypothetical protein
MIQFTASEHQSGFALTKSKSDPKALLGREKTFQTKVKKETATEE